VFAGLLAAGWWWSAAPTDARAETAPVPPVATASLGVFGVRGNEDSSTVLELEYRFPPRRWHLRPVLGAAATSDGGSYLRVGVGRDFELDERWSAHVGVASSSYVAGAGKELGSGLEFRSSLDLAYRLHDDLSLGLTVAHLSNGGLGSINPGVETLGFTLAWRQPLGRRGRGR
jgi:hypothetical protein